MKHWADSIASLTNYFVALVILPCFVGLCFGCIGGIILEKSLVKGLSKNWKLKVVGILATLTPILYVICVMSFTTY
jgi:uncharacterized membrane protein HdeD (DUF308 family)